MKVKECKSACNELEIPLSGKPFKNGKPCFRGGNGKCFQNGRHGKKAKLICTKKGILLDVVYALMTDNIISAVKQYIFVLMTSQMLF